MFAPDYRPIRLASLQSQVRFHQDQRKQVEVDPALPDDLRATLLAYHGTIIRWLHERVEVMGGTDFVIRLLIFILTLLAALPSVTWSAEAPSTEVCFTPGEDCTARLVKLLDGAQQELLVQLYSFTSAPIAKALLDNHKRGVAVTVILDKSQRTEEYSSADFLTHAGIPTYIDAQYAIAHNTIMLEAPNVCLVEAYPDAGGADAGARTACEIPLCRSELSGVGYGPEERMRISWSVTQGGAKRDYP